MPHSLTAGPIQGHKLAPRSRTSLGLESPAGRVGSLALCPLTPLRGLGPCFPARWNITPNSSALLRDLPSLVWRPPLKGETRVSAHNVIRISPVRIPPLRRKLTLRLPSLQVPGNRSCNSIPTLKTKVRAEEPEGPMEVDEQVETQGQEEEKGGPCSNGGAASTSRPLETQGNLASLNYSPRAVKGNVHSRSLTETNRTDKVQAPAVSFHSKGHGVPSAHSPAGGVLPFGKPDPAPAVLPGPVPGCSHWPEKVASQVASQVLGKDHLPSSSGLQMEWENNQRKDPVAVAGSSSFPPRAASHSSRQPKWSGQP
ncbi:UPF0607 protein [Plecturocebus cupreus]